MSELFENAVASIRMGVEDFRQQDADRNISAVRNIYAGVLLLMKHALILSAPSADPEQVIGAHLRPVPDGQGGITVEQRGRATADFQQLIERAKDFGVDVDVQALTRLNRLRNDLEHHFSDATYDAVREILSDALPTTTRLFRQIGEDPAEHLEEVWAFLLETKAVYDVERAEALSTFDRVKWYSGAFTPDLIRCLECGSELVGQEDPENEDVDYIDLKCRSCKGSPAIAATIVAGLDREFGGEAYLRAKEGMPGGPIYQCPACYQEAIHEADEICATCGEELDYESECSFCGEGISIQEFLEGSDEGTCSYCSYRMEKIMRE